MSGAAVAGLTDRGDRPALVRLIRVEARKMVDTRAGIWLLLLTALAATGGVVAERLSVGDDVAFGRMYLTAVASASLLLPVVTVLLVTSEWSQRTGLITFALVPARGRVVAAKLLAAVLLALVACAICLAFAAVGAASASGAAIELEEIGRGLLYAVIGVGTGVAIGLLLQNTPAAIVLLFVGPLLFATVGAISESLEEVTRWLDQSALQSLVEMPSPDGEEWSRIAATAGFWVLLPLVLGTLRLRRGDID